MKKLIELDAALSAIGEVPTYNDGMVFEALSHAQRDVELLPTVDAVPVVRCKDCKWYGYYSCEMGVNNWMRDGNGFCDRGERKDGDHAEGIV